MKFLKRNKNADAQTAVSDPAAVPSEGPGAEAIPPSACAEDATPSAAMDVSPGPVTGDAPAQSPEADVPGVPDASRGTPGAGLEAGDKTPSAVDAAAIADTPSSPEPESKPGFFSRLRRGGSPAPAADEKADKPGSQTPVTESVVSAAGEKTEPAVVDTVADSAPESKPEPAAAPPPAPTDPAPTEAQAPASDTALEPGATQFPENAAAKTETDTSPGFFARLRMGLGRTSDNLVQGLGNLFLGRKEIDAELFEELESRLLMADVGVEATMDIIERLTQRVSRKELTRPEALQGALREELLALLKPCEQALQVTGHKPYVILMVGVNGVGKTTTIGKLAKRYLGEGQSVMLAAGDTFRAAAVEQLQVWGDRNKVPVIAQHTGADSASVIFDGLQAAQARGVDVLIADTAGRLHNKDNLMEELKKVVRVMGKLDPGAPHEVMLVLDAGTGQNALAQAAHFQQWVGVTGLTLTKLDGTAKGGVIFAIARKLGLPIRYIGVGEAVDDLRPFEAEQFIEALFAGDDAAA